MALITIGILVIAVVASLFMAWTIGAGSSGSTPFAPAVGARAISVLRAGFAVGILGFLGAILQGGNVAQTVGTGLVEGFSFSPVSAVIILLLAAILVAIGVFANYPIATSFTVTGAVVGVGLGFGGAPAWSQYTEIAALWLLTPPVGGGIAYVTARGLRSDSVSERYSIAALGGVTGVIIANIPFALLGSGGASIAVALARKFSVPSRLGTVVISVVLVAAFAVVLLRVLETDPERGQRRFLLVLGGFVAFSAGGSQVGLAVGPLLAAFQGSSLSIAVPLLVLLAFGGFGLLLGSWTGAPRMIRTISQDYSSLGPRRAIAALIPSFIIAQTAVIFGIPVSFNEIIVSAVVGSGLAAGSMSSQKMSNTVLAWAGSLALAVGVGYGAARLFGLL